MVMSSYSLWLAQFVARVRHIVMTEIMDSFTFCINTLKFRNINYNVLRN